MHCSNVSENIFDLRLTSFKGNDALQAREFRRVQSQLPETRHHFLKSLDLWDHFV